MPTLVKGVTIPDGTYREYARNIGPSILSNAPLTDPLDASAINLDLLGLRLIDDVEITFAEGINTASATNVVANADGLSINCDVDLSAFTPGEAGVIQFDADDPNDPLLGEVPFVIAQQV